MPSNNGYQQSILWDDVHVLMVNYSRREMYLYENAGSEPGMFHIRTADAGARATITDPFEILDMAVRYAVSFELLARILDAEVVRVLDAIGVKDFLTKLVSNTTEELRRNRFKGLNFFAFTINQGTNAAAVQAEDTEEHEADEDELQDEDEVEATPTLAEAIKPQRRRRTNP
jgi:hypothetical protein